MILACQWSYFGLIEILFEVQSICWTSGYLLIFTASENEDIDTELFETSHLAGMQITIVNIFRLSLSTKMLPKVMFSWKRQLICSSITNLHSNVCNFYSSIWLSYLSIDVFLNHNIQINTNFHFSFRLRFLSIDFFSISKYTFPF